MSHTNRREFAEMLAAGVAGLALSRPWPLVARAGPARPMRGAFMILTTPFTASGDVDWEDLAREAAFVDRCGAHTFPYIEVNNATAQVEHEASTSKIGEDQIFYFQQRGISAEEAVNMIVNGFCKVVFKELPMEFAVEAQKLLGVSLEGSVG